MVFLGSAQATTILQASINFHGTTEISSDDIDFSPSQQAVRAVDLTNTAGSGDIGFVAGIGVLKAQGQVFRSVQGEGFADVLISDIIFRHSDGAACQPSCSPILPVSVAAQIDGGFSILPDVLRARGRAGAELKVRQGNTLLGSSSFNVDSDPSEDGLGPFVDTLAVTFFAETGVAYSLQMGLGLTIAGGTDFFGSPSAIKADFANTFSLDPEAVFQIGPDILVSAESAGIFNNQFVHLLPTNNGGTSVPEPGALALFGFGILGVAWIRRKSFSPQEMKAATMA